MTIQYDFVFTTDSGAAVPPGTPFTVPAGDPPHRGDVVRIGPELTPFLIVGKVYTATDNGNTEITLVLEPSEPPSSSRQSKLELWRKLGQ